jgi:antitoxin VapB
LTWRAPWPLQLSRENSPNLFTGHGGMRTTANVFTTGNSQALCVPKAFGVKVAEMWISKNEVSGEIALKPNDDDQRQRKLAELLRKIREEPSTEDFISPRSNELRPNPFEEWAEPVKPKRGKRAAQAAK